MTVKCSWCSTPVVKAAAVRYKNKNYHVVCAQAIKDRDEFLGYVCRQQHLKSPGPLLYNQRKVFIEKYGYTDSEMLMAMRYFHEVAKKKGATEGTIGVIPLVMEDAREYYRKQKARQEYIARRHATLGAKKIKIFRAETQPVVVRKRKGLVDMEALIGGEEDSGTS